MVTVVLPGYQSVQHESAVDWTRVDDRLVLTDTNGQEVAVYERGQWWTVGHRLEHAGQ